MKIIDDKYGYDRHEISRSYSIPTAFAVMALGASASAFLTLLPATKGADEQVLAQGLDKLVSLITKDFIDLSFSEAHVISSLVLVSCFIIALVILRYTSDDNKEYMEAYHYLDDFYSAEQKRAAYKTGLIFGLSSVPFFVLGIIGIAVNASLGSAILRGTYYLLLAVAVWLLLHGIILGRRVDIFAYNFRALDRISIYELEADDQIQDRKRMIAQKKLRAPMKTAKRIIVLAGCIIALCLYFLPSLETPFYWVPIAVALIASWGISIYSEHRALIKAQEQG